MIVQTTRVDCDRCPTKGPATTAGNAAARRMAKAAGWQVRGGDVCPACRVLQPRECDAPHCSNVFVPERYAERRVYCRPTCKVDANRHLRGVNSRGGPLDCPRCAGRS